MIDRFAGEYAFLSNFHPSPISLDIPDGEPLVFPNGESLFQAYKLFHVGPENMLTKEQIVEEAKKFAAAKSPREAKKMGRALPLDVASWDTSARLYMMWVQRYKYDQNDDLRIKLQATGNQTLIEGNTWGDTFWGQVNGEGENWLGRILMDLRKHYNLLDNPDKVW